VIHHLYVNVIKWRWLNKLQLTGNSHLPTVKELLAVTQLGEIMARPKKDKQFIVIEAYTANINNKKMSGKVGEIVTLSPTELIVLSRFVLPV